MQSHGRDVMANSSYQTTELIHGFLADILEQ